MVEKRHHGPGNAASEAGETAFMPSMWRAQVIRHDLGHLSPAWMVCRANERGGVPLLFKRMAGQGRAAAPAGWRGPQRSDDTGQAGRTLDATGAPQRSRHSRGV